MRIKPNESGAATAELTILLPVVFIPMLLIVVFFGRLADARGNVETAAKYAARAASIEPVVANMSARGEQAAQDELDNAGMTCHDNVSVAISYVDNGPNTSYVTADVTCDVNLSDLAGIGIGGVQTFRASYAEPVEIRREIDGP